jgi:hypothetical protein
LQTAIPHSRAAIKSTLLVPVAASATNFKRGAPNNSSRVKTNLFIIATSASRKRSAMFDSFDSYNTRSPAASRSGAVSRSPLETAS